MTAASNPATPPAWEPIGAMLQSRGLVSAQDVETALGLQRQLKARLGAILVRIGALSEDALLPVLSEQLGMAPLSAEELPRQAAEILNAIEVAALPLDWFVDHRLVLWEGVDGTFHCASRNPLDSFLQETLAAALHGRPHVWHFLRSQDVERLLKLIESRPQEGFRDEAAHLRELAEEAPVIELVSNVLAQAVDAGASDVHIEPDELSFAIRYRIDGVLQTHTTLPRDRFDAVASRIKLISDMDIAERRLPQDGRIRIRASGIEIDIRVSAVPGVHGESIVMRLLPKERADLSLQRLGMAADHEQAFGQWVREPHGIVLVTGPTGSGKSTTLYAALAAINDGRKKIITVEDPVEYKMPGITQIQTHSDIGYTFARALRAILRQDPDVIMIGEIRDLETAQIAVQSALTGHLVLSTLHTNDALSAFTRLLDMGVEPFLVASSVRAVQAQRLVRRVCACAQPATLSPGMAAVAEDLRQRFPRQMDTAPQWLSARGCPKCHGTGYRGRVGIYELAPVNAAMQDAVMRRAPATELAAIARREGYRSLREDGLIKASQGLTTVEEVLRVTGGEAEA